MLSFSIVAKGENYVHKRFVLRNKPVAKYSEIPLRKAVRPESSIRNPAMPKAHQQLSLAEKRYAGKPPYYYEYLQIGSSTRTKPCCQSVSYNMHPKPPNADQFH
jgi:hypothetical protein